MSDIRYFDYLQSKIYIYISYMYMCNIDLITSVCVCVCVDKPNKIYKMDKNLER